MLRKPSPTWPGWKLKPKGIQHHAEFLCYLLKYWENVSAEKISFIFPESFKHVLNFDSHKAPCPCKIPSVGFSFCFYVGKRLLSLVLSFGFLVSECSIWRGLIAECSVHFDCPSLNHCTMEIRFNYFILKTNEFLKHQWKDFVTEMYFLMVQSKGLVECGIDETGNLCRNNGSSYLWKLLSCQSGGFCPRVLYSCPLWKKSSQKC